MYEILRPKFPHIVEIMQQIPNTNVADIQKLDEKIMAGAQSKGKIDKYKKDLFKKITAQVGDDLCWSIIKTFVFHIFQCVAITLLVCIQNFLLNFFMISTRFFDQMFDFSKNVWKIDW